MARPSGEKVEIEFTPGVWTDVSADVRGSRVSVKYGRTTEFTDAGIAELSLELDDLLGYYTVRNAASPYYPNVQPRKRIRWSINSGATVLFTGDIKGWPPRFDGRNRFVPITAVDRMALLERIDLPAIGRIQAEALSPTVLVPLDDPDGATSVGSADGRALEIGYRGATAGGTLEFGTTVPGADFAGSFATFKGVDAGGVTTSGYYVKVPAANWTANTWSVALTFRVDLTGSPGEQVLMSSRTPNAGNFIEIGLDTGGLFPPYGITASFGATQLTDPAQRTFRDGALHTVAFTYNGSALGLYIDGQLATSTTIVQSASGYDLFIGASGVFTEVASAYAQIGMFAWWNGTVIDATQIAAYDAAMRTGFAGEMSGDRFARILGYAGIDWTTDGYVMAGKQPMGPAELNCSAAEALRAVATAEGGGAVAYVRPDGKVTFLDRTFRNPGSPIMTIDAEGDLDGDSFQPDYDEGSVVNDATATRTGGIPQRYVDAASVTAFGRSTDSVDVQTATDLGALGIAQDRVSRLAWPSLRIPRLAVDMVTAQTSGLYAAMANLAIGARVRLSGITTSRAGAVVFPLTQLDEFVEGWSIDADADTFDLGLDVSAADAPARAIWDDATNGRWQADPGSMTLQSAITSSGTTVVVVTAGGSPTLSTSGGDYPLQIRIDDEVLGVASAPGGASSPQTLTVTRGQAGTVAVAHAAGAQITLYPLSTWTL